MLKANKPAHQMLRYLCFLFLFTALQPIFATSIALAQGEDGQVYIVQADDTLWKIAEKYLGDGNRFGEVVAATQVKYAQNSTFASIADPGLIYSGSKLWIPDAPITVPEPEMAQQSTSSGSEEISSTKEAASVTVNSGDANGQIAFSFWNDSPDRCTYEINVIDVSTCLSGDCQSNRRIFALNNASEPALSPTGERLAFRGWGDIPEKHRDNQLDHPYYNCAGPRAQRHLGHTTLDGTDYYETGIFYEDSHPDWSPDARRLLFDSSREGDGITRIILISADGRNEEQLRIAGQQPSWSPDNERFAYRGCDLTGNGCGLWLGKAIPVQSWDVGLNIIGPVLEDPEAAHPDWSPVSAPGGDEIVYQSPANGSWDLYIINTDGSNKRQLTNGPDVEGLPAWSPDGQWIAYLSNAGGNWGVWIIRPDGSDQQLFFPFDGGGFTPLSVTPYFNRDWIDEQISWSQ